MLHRLDFESSGPGLREITHSVEAWLSDCAVEEGLLTLFLRHTSASLLIQELRFPSFCMSPPYAAAILDPRPGIRSRRLRFEWFV